jgi:hypothetical protein
MSAENELSISTNHNAKWNYMIDHLSGMLELSDIQPYVEILLLQSPVGGNKVGASTFHYANSPK